MTTCGDSLKACLDSTQFRIDLQKSNDFCERKKNQFKLGGKHYICTENIHEIHNKNGKKEDCVGLAIALEKSHSGRLEFNKVKVRK